MQERLPDGQNGRVMGFLAQVGKGGFDQLRIVTLLFVVILVAYAVILPGFFTL